MKKIIFPISQPARQKLVSRAGTLACRAGKLAGTASLLLALALFATGRATFAGEPSGRSLFRTYGPDQGLTDPAISCLAQDERGFLWIGTENGLVRYDGSFFRKWGTSDGLPGSWVLGIFATTEGALWLTTSHGLVRFRDGVVTPARFGPEGASSVPHHTLVDVDAKDHLWVLRRDAVYRQSGPDQLDPLPGRPPGISRALACCPISGSTFVAIEDSVWDVRPDGTWISLGHVPLGSGEIINSLTVDGTGRLWVVGARRLLFRDPGNGFVDATRLLPGNPFTEGFVHRGAKGFVCVPTNAGLLVVRGSKSEVVDRSSGLPSIWTRTGMVDREGNLWIVGPNLYRRLGDGWVRGFTDDDGLPNDLVWVVRRDNTGRLWVGTNDGVGVLNEKGWRLLPGTNGLAPAAIEPDRRGAVWFAFSNGQIKILESGAVIPSHERYLRLRWTGPAGEDPRKDQDDQPFSLLCDYSGAMWVGDVGPGIFRADLAAGTLSPGFTRKDAQVTSLVVLHFAEDRQGRLWAATNEGLICHDGSGWQRWTEREGLRQRYIEGLLPLDDGTMWVWYQEPVGLDRVAIAKGTAKVVEHLDTATALGSNKVYAVVPDWKGGVWIGLDHGIDHLAKGRIVHLSRGSGLVGEDCCANGMWSERGGDLWVGTATGLAHLQSAREPSSPRLPQSYIMSATIGRRALEMPLPPLAPIPYRDATVEFWFSSPTFLDESGVSYEVRLVGFEEEWRQAEIHLARYARLPGGSFRFEVRARHRAGEFGPVAAVSFAVRRAWWRTWWFIASLTLLATCCGVLAGLWRGRILKRQKLQLEALVEERTAALRHAKHELEQSNLALETKSLTDPLTGLRNRRYLSLIMEPEVARVIRLHKSGSNISALRGQDLLFFMVDLDRFKNINDEHGHLVGDDVLRKSADSLFATARSGDTVVRWGGDEFLLVDHGANREDAHTMAERIRRTMTEQTVRLEGGSQVYWTCSIGFAALPFQPGYPGWLGWERVVAIADRCLYAAKRAGRDAWVGIRARDQLAPALHDGLLPHDLAGLVREGLIEVIASRPMDWETP